MKKVAKSILLLIATKLILWIILRIPILKPLLVIFKIKIKIKNYTIYKNKKYRNNLMI